MRRWQLSRSALLTRWLVACVACLQLLESEDEYVDEQLLLDGTWGNYDGVPDASFLKKKLEDAAKLKAEEEGSAAGSGADGDGADGKKVVVDEGTEEKQVASVHFFRAKAHAKDVHRLVVASFISWVILRVSTVWVATGLRMVNWLLS